MADSDVIGGIENLTDAVSGETPSYEYKNPNTDMMKAISKCVDAATGETGTEYEYDNPNTDVIQKMDELAEAIAFSGGGGEIDTLVIHEGKLNLTTGDITEDSNYCYSDYFDAPNGNIMFDFGESSQTTSVGIEMCKANGDNYNYWSANDRYRVVNHATYYATAPKMRLAFRKQFLISVIVKDLVSGKAYSISPVKIEEK